MDAKRKGNSKILISITPFLKYTENPLLGIGVPLLGIVMPLLGIVMPLLGIVTPLLGIVMPLLGIVLPLLGIVTTLLGIVKKLLGIGNPQQFLLPPRLRKSKKILRIVITMLAVYERIK